MSDTKGSKRGDLMRLLATRGQRLGQRERVGKVRRSTPIMETKQGDKSGETRRKCEVVRRGKGSNRDLDLL